MKWFEGSIGDAVSVSRQKNAIFVVFIEGQDETSKSMSAALDKADIVNELETESFVSVRVESNSEIHNHFRDIYKLVPVPSVFFIGLNGAPIDIIAGENNTEDSIIDKLKSAIKKCKEYFKATLPEVPKPTNEKPEEQNKPQTSPDANCQLVSAREEPGPSCTDKTLEEERKARLWKNVEREKKKLDLQEVQKMKEKELERRRTGQEMMEAKRKQQELELQELKIKRMKEKQEEREAKQRVLEQIAQDRMNRAARGVNSGPVEVKSTVEAEVAPAPARPVSPLDSHAVRLQFKMPDGQTRNHTFPAETTLSQVRQFIDNNIVLPFREYHLATSFPRREFTARENELDLRALGLLPSAVILIMPVTGNLSMSRGPGLPRVLMDMLWDLLRPIFAFSNYMMTWFRGGGAAPGQGPGNPERTTNPPNAPTSSRTSQSRSSVRKQGNIHSLADNDNSNDENNTWNGNSTQQM